MSREPFQSVERELKLEPEDPALLDRLSAVDKLGPFEVVGRRAERQRNSFFDTPTRALRAARLALRRRCVESERLASATLPGEAPASSTLQGQALATWTLKGEGDQLGGLATRPEVELRLREDMPPGMALEVLAQAARQRGAAALAEEAADALVGSRPPLAEPFLELVTHRRILDLRDSQGAQLELALDSVQLVGHPDRVEYEIEVELRRGDEAALEVARAAIAELGNVRDGQGSKLSRALDYLRS
jgi:inorganic triphosphatase YgiF